MVHGATSLKIAILLTNPIESPGERYRAYQFIPYLTKEGFEVEVLTLFDSISYGELSSMSTLRRVALLLHRLSARTFQMAKLRKFDVVLVYRQPISWTPSLIRRYLAIRKIPFVFDFDDAIFLSSPSPLSRVSGFFRSKEEVPRLISEAAVTTVGNEYLGRFAGKHSQRVALIPTCIDLEEYDWRAPLSRKDFSIGWIGSRSTSPFLYQLDAIWPEVSRILPHARLRVVGGSYNHSAIPTEVVPWRLGCDAHELDRFDIGIMPLPDDEWAKGKCGLKILQYMAAGVPVVASPVGVNLDLIHDGVNGFLAETPEEWTAKICQLAQQPELRERFAVEGRKTVEGSYSLQRWAPVLADVLRTASRSRG